MKISILFYVLFYALTSGATPSREKIEDKIVADLAQTLRSIKSPTEALTSVKSKLKENEIAYLERLVKEKRWVELPEIQSDKNTLVFKFSGNQTLRLTVEDYWKGKFSVNGFALELDQYPRTEDRMAYLIRVVQTQNLTRKNSSLLWQILLPKAYASMTCNAIISSGCMEVSMAASLWLAREVSTDSPLERCRLNSQPLKLNDVTKKCLEQFNNSATLSTIQEMSEMLAQTPGTTVEVTCNKNSGPNISINGTEVLHLSKRGHSAEDYSITLEQDKDRKLHKLPELAIRCCKRNSADPLDGTCETFVRHHLGPKEKRLQELQGPQMRIRGKAVKGLQ